MAASGPWPEGTAHFATARPELFVSQVSQFRKSQRNNEMGWICDWDIIPADCHSGSHRVTMLAPAGVIDYSHHIDRGMPSMAGITAKRN
jgi:hypothetical protein